MNFLVYIAIFGWPVVVFFLFTITTPRRAVIASMLSAWMFLPMAGFSLPGIPNIDKMSVTCTSVLVAVSIFDITAYTRLRGNWVDLSILAWILVGIPSGISGGFGIYEGISSAYSTLVSWGMPYLIGRLYFGNAEGLRELSIGLFIAALIYVPFVLLETRVSPQLHKWVYGFRQHSFGQTKRFGGYRPMVFMQHGLAVAQFMVTGTLAGFSLWWSGSYRRFFNIPTGPLVILLIVVTLICKSVFAIALMALGICALWLSQQLSTRWILIALVLSSPVYMLSRTIGGWNASKILSMASLAGDEKEGSLQVRLDSEDVLWAWASRNTQSLLIGSGRLSGLMHVDRKEVGRFIPDGLWLIALGKNGLIGLISMYGVLLLPVAVCLYRFGPQQLFSVAGAAVAAMLMVLILYALDNLLNAMINPFYLLAAGGLSQLRRIESD